MRKGIFKAIVILVCVVTTFVNVRAQDIHYSQYNYAPLQLNPALAGLNNCDYRLALNARTQWNLISASGNTYSTFGASADFAVGKVTKFNSFAGKRQSFVKLPFTTQRCRHGRSTVIVWR